MELMIMNEKEFLEDDQDLIAQVTLLFLKRARSHSFLCLATSVKQSPKPGLYSTD
ncbi:hypothetical protein FC69_GL000159 [Latilactobacillus fuchuensis DSM 14340 = JCM 11249]|jgi:hypothetical protein|uniref:Uncharacterized protein n=1 Tax=Latilactobacillus fuchuensis DSM 14340 = JCM 11249 TaxID=1423747 RepID=A0A0R1RWL0_9LACO|nr:hypothetical protein FC69_GL000159 [Latilactobacillus fuchuensis DSM 14340 = JCM 11249]